LGKLELIASGRQKSMKEEVVLKLGHSSGNIKVVLLFW
jgi:hypothetical protein